ncbi:MAG: cyclase family protein [Acetobacteraceae bacterium]|nr:cyclase family protein [Acetobacteraceae bacterium]
MTRLVDISAPLRAGIASDPPEMLPAIDYLDHRATAPRIAEYFGVRIEDLPEGEYAAIERCMISTHNGTHVDAPYHYFSRMNEAIVPGGEPSMRIDEVPLEWLFQPAVKLDFRHLPDGHVVSPAEIEAELKRIGHVLRPLEMVLANTRAGSRYGEADYIDAGCGFGRAATLWLTEQSIRVVGTDGWSWDAPFSHTKRRVQETGDASLIWEGHRVGRDRAYCQIEKLHGLEALPPDGFTVAAFPVKVHRGSAGWTRAVAILSD